MRSLLVALIAALALNVGAASAEASCIQQTLAEQDQRAEVVAFGRVNGSSFEVRQVLKGQASGTIQVRFGAGPPGVFTSVDYMPANGTDHTLYLRKDAGEWATDACSGSHRGAPTAEERVFYNVSEVATGGTASSGETHTAGPALSLGPAALVVALAATAIVAIAILRGRRKETA